MIQAAITKRLPVFAGGDEGVVFAALFSFLRAVCAAIADAMLSATSANGERHPACARSYLIVGRREFFGDRVPAMRMLREKNSYR